MDDQKYQYQPILQINCIYSSKWFPNNGFCNFLPLTTWWTERCNSMLKCGKWNQAAVGDGKSKVGRASLVEFLCHVRAVGKCFIGDSFPIFHSAWCCIELHLFWRCQLQNLGNNGNLQTNLGSKFSIVFVWAWQTGIYLSSPKRIFVHRVCWSEECSWWVEEKMWAVEYALV